MSVLILGGRPGSGKSAAVKRILQGYSGELENIKPTKLVNAVYVPSQKLHVLGKYDEGETFPGTDRLSMAVQPKAVEWIGANRDEKILLEGDRLFNSKFVSTLLEAGIDVHVWILECSEEALQNRYKQRGSNQSEKFLKGRATKVNNMIEFCSGTLGDAEFKVVTNEREEDSERLSEDIRKFFKLV